MFPCSQWAILLVVVLGTLAVSSTYAETEESSHVMELNDQDFTAAVSTLPLALVKFYAPWCGHCKRLAPHFDEAAKLLAGSGITLVKIDAEKNRNAANKYNVDGFPTLLIFRHGLEEPYDGPRDSANAIVRYMKDQAKEVAEEITSVDMLHQLVKTRKSATSSLVIGCFVHEGDRSVFFQVMRKLKGGVTGYYTTDDSIMSELGYYSDKSSVLIYPVGNQKRLVYRDNMSPTKLSTFLVQTLVRDTFVLTKENEPLLEVWSNQHAPTNAVQVSIYVNAESRTEALEEKIRQLKAETKNWWSERADKSNSPLLVAIIPKDVSRYTPAQFGFTDATVNNLRALTIQALSSGVVYTLPDAMKLEELYQALQSRSLVPYLKSQIAPSETAPGEVVPVVGSTFERIVQDQSKFVLLEFYAPWCGHCKALEPTYIEVAKAFENDPSVVIAKFDATNNDVPKALRASFSFSGFPTIFFVPNGASKSNVQKYEGSRTRDEMVEWVRARIGK